MSIPIIWCLVLVPLPHGNPQEASATQMIFMAIMWCLRQVLPPQWHPQEATAPTSKIATIIIWHPHEAPAPTRKFVNLIIGVLLLMPPSQGHPHEAQATCKTSYATCAPAKATIHGHVPIPFACIAMAKVTSHGSATRIKTRRSRRRKAPPPSSPSSKRRATMSKLRSLLPPTSVQVHLWRRPWRRRRLWSFQELLFERR